MRPDVALAFDRMERAARARRGRAADQQRLPLGRRAGRSSSPATRTRSGSRRRARRCTAYGTELDLGPPAAYGWLAANAGRFHFVQRYAWEPWHYGYILNARSSRRRHGRGRRRRRTLPAFVPAAFAPLLARAAQRWNVSAALLAAQLYAESNFNPFAVSPAGAQGIAQFMPGTAAAHGLATRSTPSARSTPRRT